MYNATIIGHSVPGFVSDCFGNHALDHSCIDPGILISMLLDMLKPLNLSICYRINEKITNNFSPLSHEAGLTISANMYSLNHWSLLFRQFYDSNLYSSAAVDYHPVCEDHIIFLVLTKDMHKKLQAFLVTSLVDPTTLTISFLTTIILTGLIWLSKSCVVNSHIAVYTSHPKYSSNMLFLISKIYGIILFGVFGKLVAIALSMPSEELELPFQTDSEFIDCIKSKKCVLFMESPESLMKNAKIENSTMRTKAIDAFKQNPAKKVWPSRNRFGSNLKMLEVMSEQIKFPVIVERESRRSFYQELTKRDLLRIITLKDDVLFMNPPNLGFAYRTDGLNSKLQNLIRIAFSSGSINEYFQDLTNRYFGKQNHFANKLKRNNFASNCNPLTLYQILGAFLLLICSNSFCIIIFVVEQLHAGLYNAITHRKTDNRGSALSSNPMDRGQSSDYSEMNFNVCKRLCASAGFVDVDLEQVKIVDAILRSRDINAVSILDLQYKLKRL